MAISEVSKCIDGHGVRHVAEAMEAEVKTDICTAKDEVDDNMPPGLSLETLLPMSNEDLWQHAWATTWEEADSVGKADDEQALYATARESWKQWRALRDSVSQQRAVADGRGAADTNRSATPAGAGSQHVSAQPTSEPQWADKQAKAEWSRAVADTERQKKAQEEAPKTSRDLCTLVKQ